MKNKIISIIQALVLLWGVTSCHSPEELGSDIQREGINSITASFPNDDSSENSFKGEIDYTNHSITFVFPYNYPKLSDNVLPTSALKRVRLSASLANNVSVTPPLLYMDLTQDNYITVKDQTSGTSTEFKVIGEIRKSNECEARKKHQSKGDGNKENQTERVVKQGFCGCLPLQPNSKERQDNASFPLPSHYLSCYQLKA